MEFSVFLGIFAAFIAWIIVLVLMGGIYTVDQNERAIKTTFGRAPRLTVTTLDDPISANLNDEESSDTNTRRCASSCLGDRISNCRGRKCIKSRSPRKP